jgi:MoxR-like ATPase
MSDKQDWKIFTGQVHPAGDDPIARLLTVEPPPWRNFQKQEQPFVADDLTIRTVNAAIYLRRPLLVTGKPGSGKSALAHAIAHQLHLEPLLKWPITTRTTLQDGQYRYDALSRLRDVQANSQRRRDDTIDESAHLQSRDENIIDDVARYIRLGPLGTAFASFDRPRVLLIEEIDKGDVDLPNDLLHIFETGEFDIPELTRFLLTSEVDREHGRKPVMIPVETYDSSRVEITNGRVHCKFFPIIVLTSNGERTFPPAFMRRCIQLEMQQPNPSQLEEIIKGHLGAEDYERAEQQIMGYIELFVQKRTDAKGDLATDQLLNLVYLMTRDIQLDEETKKMLVDKLLEKLSID